jgi:hypothetical protein
MDTLRDENVYPSTYVTFQCDFPLHPISSKALQLSTKTVSNSNTPFWNHTQELLMELPVNDNSNSVFKDSPPFFTFKASELKIEICKSYFVHRFITRKMNLDEPTT